MSKTTVAIFDLCVTSNSPIGSCLLQMIRGLCEDYQFVVFADKFENPAPERIKWIRVPLPEKPVFLRFMAFNWLAPQYYRNYVRVEGEPQLIIGTEGEFTNCDICYAHFCHKAYLKRFPNKASLLRRFARSINRRFNASQEVKAYTHAEIIVVPSKGLANELTQVYGSLLEKKIKRIPNPVDVEHFTRPKTFDSQLMRTKLGLSSDDIVLVFAALGDFDRKGLKPLLEALAVLKNPQAKLLVVGGTQSEIKEYAAIRDRLELSKNVVFLGFQSDVRPYLWLSDLFVFPSNYEVFPLVTLQAAVASLPIIATKVYGVEEFLQNGVNGWLIERDAKCIAETLKVALTDRERLLQMGVAAHNTASEYNKTIFVERWHTVLSSLI